MNSALHIASHLSVSPHRQVEIPDRNAPCHAPAISEHHDCCRMLAEASHDLRQPVHALGLYVAELRRKITGMEQQHLVGQVERSVDAITTLIDALFDLSRLDAGIVVPNKQVCDIAALFDRINTDFQMAASARNIRLVVRPCHEQVISDPLLLERIVMNLVSNALRYTSARGTVLIACRRRSGHVVIEVRDNGIGIEKARQADIFREFFQLSHLNTRNGLGLGLAIVDRLAKLLGHPITLRSAPGKGSRFMLRLDSALISDKHAAPSTAGLNFESCPLTGKKVLIVDKDRSVLEATARIIGSWGGQISAVSSLKSVRRLLAKGASWDLVISDYQMENNVTGLDIIQSVRRHLCAQTPCILISADTRPMPLKLARIAGHPLLHKPVKPAKLRSLVQFLLEERAVIV